MNQGSKLKTLCFVPRQRGGTHTRCRPGPHRGKEVIGTVTSSLEHQSNLRTTRSNRTHWFVLVCRLRATHDARRCWRSQVCDRRHLFACLCSCFGSNRAHAPAAHRTLCINVEQENQVPKKEFCEAKRERLLTRIAYIRAVCRGHDSDRPQQLPQVDFASGKLRAQRLVFLHTDSRVDTSSLIA